jgi:hypothetical protein
LEAYRVTVYVARGSDFSLPKFARLLRSWQPPPHVELVGKDRLGVCFGEWCIRLAWEQGARGARVTMESDPDDGENLNTFCDCEMMIVEDFQGVAVLMPNGRWLWRDEQSAAIPIPSHLAGCLARAQLFEDGTYVEGALRCPCGREQLELLYPGATHVVEGHGGMPVPCSVQVPNGRRGKRWWFGLAAVCTACRKRRVLFDSDRHGWDAFVSSPTARKAKSPRPRLRPWHCLNCGAKAHEGVVHFRFDGPGDFLRRTEGAYPVGQRIDAFGWFGMGIKCCECAHETPDWVGYETR